jgi:hypothetical protein
LGLIRPGARTDDSVGISENRFQSGFICVHRWLKCFSTASFRLRQKATETTKKWSCSGIRFDSSAEPPFPLFPSVEKLKHIRNNTETLGRNLTLSLFFPLLPEGGAGRGEVVNGFTGSNPLTPALTPALTPLGRGEGGKLRPKSLGCQLPG